MKDLDLTFTEQVFLQESGYCPEGPKDEVKQEPLIKSLLDVYKELERPVRKEIPIKVIVGIHFLFLYPQIVQTDGLADGSDGVSGYK